MHILSIIRSRIYYAQGFRGRDEWLRGGTLVCVIKHYSLRVVYMYFVYAPWPPHWREGDEVEVSLGCRESDA